MRNETEKHVLAPEIIRQSRERQERAELQFRAKQFDELAASLRTVEEEYGEYKLTQAVFFLARAFRSGRQLVETGVHDTFVAAGLLAVQKRQSDSGVDFVCVFTELDSDYRVVDRSVVVEINEKHPGLATRTNDVDEVTLGKITLLSRHSLRSPISRETYNQVINPG